MLTSPRTPSRLGDFGVYMRLVLLTISPNILPREIFNHSEPLSSIHFPQ